MAAALASLSGATTVPAASGHDLEEPLGGPVSQCAIMEYISSCGIPPEERGLVFERYRWR
ncbi:MAG TPA: hypothetical protein VNJ46_04405 [Gaiellaceae bacterium]|nr:hypothetical protein [Gaiellaceae bacterium]